MVGQDVYIRTNIFGTNTNLPLLVLVHGYASSGPLFFKIIANLTNHFTLITLDIPGMGGSSRPDDFKRTFGPEECNMYFINYIEKWREAMGITGFYLSGHSFGGYLVG